MLPNRFLDFIGLFFSKIFLSVSHPYNHWKIINKLVYAQKAYDKTICAPAAIKRFGQ